MTRHVSAWLGRVLAFIAVSCVTFPVVVPLGMLSPVGSRPNVFARRYCARMSKWGRQLDRQARELGVGNG